MLLQGLHKSWLVLNKIFNKRHKTLCGETSTLCSSQYTTRVRRKWPCIAISGDKTLSSIPTPRECTKFLLGYWINSVVCDYYCAKASLPLLPALTKTQTSIQLCTLKRLLLPVICTLGRLQRSALTKNWSHSFKHNAQANASAVQRTSSCLTLV